MLLVELRGHGIMMIEVLQIPLFKCLVIADHASPQLIGVLKVDE